MIRNQVCIGIIAFLNIFSCFSSAEPGWVNSKTDPSIVKIEDNFGRCTGTRISSKGHILTARHCFNACLISNDLVNKTLLFPEFGYQSPTLYSFPNDKKASCSVRIDDAPQQVEILVASSAFMTPMELSSLTIYDVETYKRLLNNYYLHNGDFAIIKTDMMASFSCKKISHKKTNVGDEVSYIGYPAASTGRPSGLNSDGTQLAKANGKITASILSNSCISKNKTDDLLVQKYDRPELLLSSVDVLPGASGSALLDNNGAIVGLINSTYAKGIDIFSNYCSGSAVAISINHILQQINERELSAVDFFDCGTEK